MHKELLEKSFGTDKTPLLQTLSSGYGAGVDYGSSSSDVQTTPQALSSIVVQQLCASWGNNEVLDEVSCEVRQVCEETFHSQRSH